MPKILAYDLSDRLLAEIARHPRGLAASDLARLFAKDASPRSIGRKLQSLVRQQRILTQGSSRGVRYFTPEAPAATQPAAAQPAELQPPAVQPPDAGSAIAFSNDALTMLSWVRAPLLQRRPVGYDRGFLEAYVPNETSYLADPERSAWLQRRGRHALGARLADTYARSVLDRLLIDLSWASSKLEGNTYTRLDTVRLIEQGVAAEGSDRLQTQMILNHKAAIEFLVTNAAETGMDMHTMLNLHALLSENLLADPAAEGRLRTRAVDIQGTVFRPLDVPAQIEECFRLLLDKASGIQDPFELALFLMVHIPYLQPFEDANKRVSRLAANIPLIRAGLCPLSFVDMPEKDYVDSLLAVYERNRIEPLREVFLFAYERSCEQFQAITANVPEPDPFRLRYRAELVDVVAGTVRAAAPMDADAVRRAAAGLVRPEDGARLADMAIAELRQLHEGNYARYGLRLAEFRAWKAQQG